nr:hypothetical protein [Tanacetum cinerariifolium]
MQNLERQLHKETFHEKDSNSDLRVIKVQFEHFIPLKVLDLYNYNSYDLEIRRDFKEYTQMEAQTFKETIIQNMNSNEQCIVERENHEQVLQNGLKRLTERKLQTQTCKDMCDNDIQNDQNVVECDDERVVLANLIAYLKLDVDENKNIQKQLKKANTTLTQELKECKSILAETS